jgi:hypothetical protein
MIADRQEASIAVSDGMTVATIWDLAGFETYVCVHRQVASTSQSEVFEVVDKERWVEPSRLPPTHDNSPACRIMFVTSTIEY